MTAFSQSAKEVVVATGANGQEKFSCPDCDQPVYPRNRAKWAAHFVHKRHSACRTKLVAPLESDEHKQGKHAIAEYLRGNVSDPTIDVVIEKTITTIDGRCREIDVAIARDGKVIEAHECQLSPIGVLVGGKSSLQARILDYYQLGIPSTWWLGGDANTETVREYLLGLIQQENEHFRLTENGHTILMGYTIESSFNTKLEKVIEQEKMMEEFKQPEVLPSAETPITQGEKFIEHLFKYSNPQTVKALIKDAIANALDSNPSDATALCAAWEKIQPTLAKPSTPSLTDRVAAGNLSFVTNGNGNGHH